MEFMGVYDDIVRENILNLLLFDFIDENLFMCIFKWK